MQELFTNRYIIFDVETTGLSPAYGDRVVEIAAVKLQDMKIVDQFHALVNPEREISFRAYLVNGITPEMVQDALKAEDVFPSFLQFIGSSTLVGHNVKFDTAFLSNELALIGERQKRKWKTVDTLRMARGLRPGLSSYSLLSVAQSFQIKKNQEHRALSDVYLTYDIFCRLMELAAEKALNEDHLLVRLFGQGETSRREEERQKISLIREAIEQKREVRLAYFSAARISLTERRVLPQKIVKERSITKLVGFCHLRREQRDFRLDRIMQLQKI